MPYQIRGNDIYHKVNGTWKLKQHCTSVENAESAMRLLEGLEHGSIKARNVGRKALVRAGKRHKKRAGKDLSLEQRRRNAAAAEAVIKRRGL